VAAVGGDALTSALGSSSVFVSIRTMSTRRIAADDSWFAGPPYAVPEEIFDEHSMAACSLSPGLGDE